MSITVTVRFPVSDVAKAIAGLQENAETLEAVTVSAKTQGGIHHRFVSGDGEIMAINEWESAETFHGFFHENAQIEAIMTSLGLSGPPTVTMYAPVEAPGAF